MVRLARTFISEKPCKRGHFVRFAWNKSRCVECTRLDSEKYRAANRDRMNARKRAQWAADPEKAREYSRDSQAKRRAANGERVREVKRSWNAKFPAGNRRRAQEWMRVWSLEDRESYNAYKRAYTAKRRAAKRRAIPQWLAPGQWQEIRALYAKAAEITAETGIQHHVDHIIPLRSKVVCGLHVPWNMRVIPGAENMRKTNFLIEGV